MTWTLAKSRALFFKETGEPAQDSFWVGERERLLERGAGTVNLGSLLEWDPSALGARSNCPALHATIDELVTLVDPRWRARADNIYAGRTTGHLDLAFSRHGQKGGAVAVSSQLSMSLIAYVNLWARFLHLFDMSHDTPVDDWNAIEGGLRNEFSQLIRSFQGHGLPALLGQWPLTFASHDHGRAAFEHVASAERWIVAHELSHHILRHGTARPDRLAREAIDAGLRRDEVACELVDVTTAQREEIAADILAFELIAGEYANDANAVTVLQAYQGACIALVAVGHLQGDWLAEPNDSHPGAISRLVILTKWVLSRYRDLVGELLESMPGERQLHRLAASLTSFVIWASGLSPDVLTINRPTEADRTALPKAVDNYLNLAVMLGDFDTYGRGVLLIRSDAS